MQAMFESIEFIELDYSEMVETWRQRLIGKRLASLEKSPTGQQPRPINLCDKGIVASEASSAQATSPVPQQMHWNGYNWVSVPVAPMPRPPVRWDIVPLRGKPTLLIHDGPRPLELVLQMEDDQLLVNGRPHEMTTSSLCQ